MFRCNAENDFLYFQQWMITCDFQNGWFPGTFLVINCFEVTRVFININKMSSECILGRKKKTSIACEGRKLFAWFSHLNLFLGSDAKSPLHKEWEEKSTSGNQVLRPSLFVHNYVITSVIIDYTGMGSHFCRGVILRRTSNSTLCSDVHWVQSGVVYLFLNLGNSILIEVFLW